MIITLLLNFHLGFSIVLLVLFKCQMYINVFMFHVKIQSIFAKSAKRERTSDGGNGNHSVWLPIILIKIKVDQMLLSSYIISLLVAIL